MLFAGRVVRGQVVSPCLLCVPSLVLFFLGGVFLILPDMIWRYIEKALGGTAPGLLALICKTAAQQPHSRSN